MAAVERGKKLQLDVLLLDTILPARLHEILSIESVTGVRYGKLAVLLLHTSAGRICVAHLAWRKEPGDIDHRGVLLREQLRLVDALHPRAGACNSCQIAAHYKAVMYDVRPDLNLTQPTASR